ncbi:MAG TPA: IS1 family transposase [Polyangiaceae bacterium]|jgi:IS1 family transposase
MNQLDAKTRKQIVACLVDGASIRATCRITGAAKKTVLRLIAELGDACDEYQDRTLRGLSVQRVQCDEIWAFCYAKEKNVPSHKAQEGAGSVWTWTAIDADTRLVVSYYVGSRNAGCANRFMRDVASRIVTRVQLTTDGHKAYLYAIGLAFGGDVDYSQLVKLYGQENVTDGRYSPAKCMGIEERIICGDPDPDFVSTSYVERANLTMRMNMRRFTRLTNGFSKKLENHEHAVAIHFMTYNFCNPHSSLGRRGQKVTPAMAAGVTDHVWTLDEVIDLLPKRQGPRVRIGSAAVAGLAVSSK